MLSASLGILKKTKQILRSVSVTAVFLNGTKATFRWLSVQINLRHLEALFSAAFCVPKFPRADDSRSVFLTIEEEQ